VFSSALEARWTLAVKDCEVTLGTGKDAKKAVLPKVTIVAVDGVYFASLDVCRGAAEDGPRPPRHGRLIFCHRCCHQPPAHHPAE
jgi:hypothetical protein